MLTCVQDCKCTGAPTPPPTPLSAAHALAPLRAALPSSHSSFFAPTGFDYGFDATRARCRICSSTSIVGTEASILDAAVCYDRTAGCLDLP